MQKFQENFKRLLANTPENISQLPITKVKGL